MSTTDTIRVPAGWFPDPVGMSANGVALQRRWWDGTGWTGHTAPLQSPASPVVSAEAVSRASTYAAGTPIVITAPATLSPRDSALVAENMSLHPGSASSPTDSAAERPASVGSAGAHSAPRADGTYEPFSHRRSEEMLDGVPSSPRRRHRRGDHELRAHTVSAWLMATMPFTQALLMVAVFTSLPAESSAWTRALTLVFPFVLYAALAEQDVRQLHASGHVRTAPWALAMITPPLYLAVRGVHVRRATGAESWPLLVWAVAQACVLATWWLLDPAGVAAVLATFS